MAVERLEGSFVAYTSAQLILALVLYLTLSLRLIPRQSIMSAALLRFQNKKA